MFTEEKTWIRVPLNTEDRELLNEFKDDSGINITEMKDVIVALKLYARGLISIHFREPRYIPIYGWCIIYPTEKGYRYLSFTGIKEKK